MLKLKPRNTVEDYLKLPEDVRAELIEGEIFMSPSPRSPHQLTLWKLGRMLGDFAEAQGLGVVVGAPFDVHLPSGDVVQPDLFFVSAARRGIIQDWVRGVPDLVVEVISPEGAERDRIVKRDLYARNGVPEYWIADPAARTLEIFRLEGGTYASHGYFEPGDTATSPSFPGLSLPLASISPPATK